MNASTSRTSAKAPRSPESYESLNRRNAAAEILQSYEKLSWYSFQRCESLAQTRLHFQYILAGFSEEDEAALIDWKEDRTPRPKPGEDEPSSRKGKERVSSGSTGGGDGTAGGSAQRGNKSRQTTESEATSPGLSSKKKRKSLG